LPNGGQPTAVNQGFYSPAVDPYDPNHLLMAQHQGDLLAESHDGGKTWSAVPLDPGLAIGGGATFGINFIDTNDPSTTKATWLCMAASSAGTWRTEDSGQHWAKVQTVQHPAGISRILQPDRSGSLFMAGVYSTDGDGVFASNDFGKTWRHLGASVPERVVVGTAKNLYAMYGWACGAGCDVNPNLEIAAQPGTSAWSSPPRPTGMTQGPAAVATTHDGAHAILIAAAYNAGLFRYVEP
jgi:hypothetical protein